jgi:hypothetical protein
MLRVLRDILLWKLFGPKREGETGGWIKLHNEDIYNVYLSRYNIMMIKFGG